MKIYYDTFTKNVEKFCHKLPFECQKITENLIVDEHYVLITYTTGFGQVPNTTQDFVTKNPQIIAIASSGNKNWGDNYAKSADIISKQFNLNYIFKFELQGTKKDIEKFESWITKIKGELNEIYTL